MQPTKANGKGSGSLMGLYKDRPQIVGDAFNHLSGIHDHLTIQTQLLESLVERSYVETEADIFKWLRSGVLTANAAGEADTTGVTVLENRTGYEMELVSWAVACNNAAANGGVLFYLGSIDNNNLIWAES